MPKTRKRKKTAGRISAGSVAVQEQRAREVPANAARRPGMNTGGASLQNAVFSTMVALGFWGLAAFCIFFYAVDPNHNLYGGIMVLIALGWSTLAVRRWSSYRR